MSKNKDGQGVYIRKDESITFRVLEVPSERTVGNKVYHNFKNLTGYHSKRLGDGSYSKVPCANPYKNKDLYCEQCQQSSNISKEYIVEVQMFAGTNGSEIGEPVSPVQEYDLTMSYTLRMQSSLATALSKKFAEMQKTTGLALEDFPYIVFKITKVKGDPWYVVDSAVLKKDIPLPSIARFHSAEVKSFTPVGADNPNIYKSKTPPVIAGFGLADFNTTERENIVTMAEMIKEVMDRGDEVTIADIRDHMIKSIGIVAKDEKAKEEKVEWALTNMFDKDFNLCVKL